MLHEKTNTHWRKIDFHTVRWSSSDNNLLKCCTRHIEKSNPANENLWWWWRWTKKQKEEQEADMKVEKDKRWSIRQLYYRRVVVVDNQLAVYPAESAKVTKQKSVCVKTYVQTRTTKISNVQWPSWPHWQSTDTLCLCSGETKKQQIQFKVRKVKRKKRKVM